MHSTIHFSGLPVDPEAYSRWARRVLSMGMRQTFTDGHELFEWRDKSRFGLILYASAEQVRCLTPYYEGNTKVRAGGVTIERFNDCPWCDLQVIQLVGEDGSKRFPLRFHNAEVSRYRNGLDRIQDAWFCITAWAMNTTIYTSEKAQLAAHADDLKTEDGQFVRPVGPQTILIHRRGEDGRPVHDATIFMTATVLRAREKTETLAGTSFIHCVAETAGAQFEVILAGEQKPPSPPRKGHVLEGWFALTGTMSRVTGR